MHFSYVNSNQFIQYCNFVSDHLVFFLGSQQLVTYIVILFLSETTARMLLFYMLYMNYALEIDTYIQMTMYLFGSSKQCSTPWSITIQLGISFYNVFIQVFSQNQFWMNYTMTKAFKISYPLNCWRRAGAALGKYQNDCTTCDCLKQQIAKQFCAHNDIYSHAG